MRVWEAASGKQLQVFQVQRQLPWAMALSPDGKTLATGSFDKTIKVFDTGTGKEPRTLTGHIREVSGLAFSPDGRRLVSIDQDGVARMWDTATWEVLQKWGGPRYIKPGEFSAEGNPSFSPDGKWLAIRGAARDVWVFDAQTARVVRRLTVEKPSGEHRILPLGPASVAHDSQRIVAFDSGGKMLVWETSNWKRKDVALSGIRTRQGWYWPSAIALSPDDRLLAMATGENAYIVELASGKKLLTLSGHTGGVWALAFSPDGRWLATGATDDVVMLWDVATGRAIRRLGTRPPPREMTDY